ncbi:MAG: glycosyltransferase family 4 protein [Sphingomonadales bacterium]|nr:glycosyltransferase family 4 protein [Sphingomonadales bacterium]
MNAAPAVLFDADIFLRQRVGGISRLFVELARALPAEGIAPRIAAPFHINALLAALPRGIFPWGQRRLSGRFAVAAARRLPDATALAARRTSARLLHPTYYPPRPLRSRLPMVITVHDMIHERDASFAGDPVIGWKAQAIAHADRIVCVSQSTRLDLLARFPAAEARTVVIPLAASLPAAPNAPPPQPRPYVLYVGERCRAYKNFAGLLRAMPLLDRALDLVAVGGGAFSPDERAAIAGLGLAGRVRQIACDDHALAIWYAHAAALAYPSTCEGFGIPALEAMAAGCPVVALARASLPEVCGPAACYAEAPEPEALAQALRRVTEDADLARQLRAAGLRQAARFSWQRCAASHAAVYRELIGAEP